MAQTGTPHRTGGDQSLGDLVALAAKDVSQLIHCEIDLAKTELRSDLRRAALVGALLGVAAFVGCLMLVMLCFAFAYGLMTIGIWSWAAFLVTAGACVLLIAVAAVVALLRLRGFSGLRGTRTSVRDSIAALRRAVRRTSGTPRGDARSLPADGPRSLPEQGTR